MSVDNYYVNTMIKPRTLLYKNKKHEILQCKNEFIINGYTIEFDLETRRIISVNIGSCHHPNAIDPTLFIKPPQLPSKYTLWCMPDFLKKIELNNKTPEMISEMLSVWDFNTCYWKNINCIKYK